MLEEPAMVDKQKYPVSNKDRHLVCQEEVDGPLQMILEEATATAGKRLKQSEVLRNLRVCTPMRMTTRKTGTKRPPYSRARRQGESETIYAWTISVRGRQDVQHVTTLDELRDYSRVMDLPGMARPNLPLWRPKCITTASIPTPRAASMNGR